MDLLPHSLTHAVKQSGSATKNDILEQVLADVHVTLLHGVIAVLVDALDVEASDLRMEHYLGGSESFVSDQDLPAVWKLVVLLAGVRSLGLLDGLVEVVDDIAHFFLDFSHDLELSLSSELITSLIKDLLEIVGDISSCQMDSLDGVGDSVSLVDGHGMGHTVT